jgi:hypothetical protein
MHLHHALRGVKVDKKRRVKDEVKTTSTPCRRQVGDILIKVQKARLATREDCGMHVAISSTFVGLYEQYVLS